MNGQYLGLRRGFSLIEMLVVGALIMLLVALLLPSLKQTRAAGQRTRCASNMRQTFMSVRAMLVDRREEFPTSVWRPVVASSNQIVWHVPVFAGKYMDPTLGIRHYNGAPVEVGLIACPLLPAVFNFVYTDQLLNTNVPIPYPDQGGLVAGKSWGENFAINARYFTLDQPFYWPSIKRPAQVYFMGDASDYNIYGLYSGWDMSLGFRHLETMNMTFADGHQQVLKLEDIPTNYRTAQWTDYP